ncbi:MAG TPA: hypothetical protein PL089_07925 [Ignavibacteria bacterium]|nr:hypothetical protein [Ignavibacteria bacterium]
METKVSELTVSQLKELISTIVQEKIEDTIEDLKSLTDEGYIQSIKESRAEYKAGMVTDIDDILDA